MSNFSTFGCVTEGYPGTAVAFFMASTVDSSGTITATGYLNDKAHVVKANDVFWINYSDLSVFPLNPGQNATFGQFQVVVSGGNTSLVASAFSSALLPLAGGVLSGGATGYPIIVRNVTVGEAALASAGSVTLLPSSGSHRYQIVDIFANSGGTNFSGGGGDRLGAITDNTSVYSVIPAASLQTLANAKWGSTAVPAPASVPYDTLTAAGAALVMKYSGGSADYTAGSVVITVVAVQVA